MNSFFVDTFDVLFIDTCSLMRLDFHAWLKDVLPSLLASGKKIWLPYPVLNELCFLADGSRSASCREASGKAHALAKKMLETGIAVACGDCNKAQQADFYFVKACTGFPAFKGSPQIEQHDQRTSHYKLQAAERPPCQCRSLIKVRSKPVLLNIKKEK